MSRPGKPAGKPAVSAMAAGFQFAICVLLPVWGGVYLDRNHGTHPWGILAGFILGLLVGTWSVFIPLWRETDSHPRETGRRNEEEDL